jgi:allophanate hydrolase subunit 2
VLERSPDRIVNDLAYSHPTIDMTTSGWIAIGTAEITVTVNDHEALLKTQIDALRRTQKAIEAEASAKSTRIEQQIQSLLAIGYESTEA